MDAIECIKSRRSIRKFEPTPVPDEIIKDLIDCARLAPSGSGLQPWEFVAVKDQATREKIAEAARYGKFIKDAPVCIAVYCKDVKRAVEDGSAAAQNILLAAWAHGLGTCWVAGHNTDYEAEVNKILGVPAEYKLITLIPVGYFDKSYIPMPKKRTVEEVIHWEKF